MRPEIQKKIWDVKQVKRIGQPYAANKKRVDTIFKEIDKLSPDPKATVRVLNIGIGNGSMEELLSNSTYDVYSLDPSENAVAILAERLGSDKSHFRVGSSASLPFEDCFFDFVIMSEVLEHLDEETLSATLNEISRTLKSGGIFIGTVPHNEDLERSTSTCAYCGHRAHRVGHVHSFTPHTLGKLLSTRFLVMKCKPFCGMYLNWKGILLHHYVDLPYKIARLFCPDVRAPHQIEFNILFLAKKA